MSAFKYTHAVVCRLANSWKNSVGAPSNLNLEIAKKQHEEYVSILRKLNIDVVELPADEEFPDSVYVEDTAVVCNGIALITRPGHPSRSKETETMKTILKKELELPIVEIANPKATLDGGDVLFTGHEFFVGISERTNEAGAAAVAAAFPEYPCTPIKVADNLHLKSLITMAGPDILCVGNSNAAQTLLRRIERVATFRYQTLTVPDDAAANCVYANGALIHRSQDEFPRSAAMFEERIAFQRYPINYSEVAKPQAALTCCSILIRKSKSMRL